MTAYRGLNFGLSIHIYPYFLYASSECSGESVHHLRKPTVLSPLRSLRVRNEVDLVPLACEDGLCICADSPEPSLLTDAMHTELSCTYTCIFKVYF